MRQDPSCQPYSANKIINPPSDSSPRVGWVRFLQCLPRYAFSPHTGAVVQQQQTQAPKTLFWLISICIYHSAMRKQDNRYSECREMLLLRTHFMGTNLCTRSPANTSPVSMLPFESTEIMW